jgi:hypothetical protein
MMDVNTRNMYSCLYICNKLNTVASYWKIIKFKSKIFIDHSLTVLVIGTETCSYAIINIQLCDTEHFNSYLLIYNRQQGGNHQIERRRPHRDGSEDSQESRFLVAFKYWNKLCLEVIYMERELSKMLRY